MGYLHTIKLYKNKLYTIYIVDYITNLNAAIFTFPSAIPGISTQHNNNNNIKNIKSKRFKKK